MKILFYGNCQAKAAMTALRLRNPKLAPDYAPNDPNARDHDPERSAALMDQCDHIVAQPIMNMSRPDNHLALKARFAERITFMPYLWIDGLYALCEAPALRRLRRGAPGAGVLGAEIVLKRLAEVGLEQTETEFRKGLLPFDHAGRLERSLTELEAREAHCDVKIAPMIRADYRDRVVMLTHNHPHPDLINALAGQLAERLGLKWSPITGAEPVQLAGITLPDFSKVLSPQTVQELGLTLPYDLQWLRTGRKLIAQIAASAGSAADDSD